MYRCLAVLSFFALLLTSCNVIYSPNYKSNLACPQIEQQCKPVRWKGVPDDTSKSYRDNSEEYYVIEPVKQINTKDDEWQLSFFPNGKAAMTYSDKDEQKIMLVRMPRENRASIESGIGVPLDGSVGAVSVFNDSTIYFSGLENKIYAKNNDFENRKFRNITDTTNLINADKEYLAKTDIYEGHFNGLIVSDVKSLSGYFGLPVNCWKSQPAISKSGKILFFVAKIDDIRGTDIFFSYKKADNSWSKAVNCGNIVNTQCDELTPFVAGDSILYFASCGHETVGGYDIFKSTISPELYNAVKEERFDEIEGFADRFFSVPENLKAPLNTPADEMFPSCPDGNCDSLLYYASAQNNSGVNVIYKHGGFDIYLRKKVHKVKMIAGVAKEIKDNFDLNVLPDDTLIESPKIEIFNLQGTVYNKKNNERVPNSDIRVKETEFNTEVSHFKSDTDGEYSIPLPKNREFEVTAQSDTLFYDSYRIKVDAGDTCKTIRHDFKLPELILLRINFPYDVYDDPYRYTLDSNGVETNVTWENELDNLAQNILSSLDKIQKISLVGYTDDIGSADYNKQLGQHRVDFVIAELVKRNVPENILAGRSEGKRQLLQRFSDEDIKLYRKRLRRVEILKVLK